MTQEVMYQEKYQLNVTVEGRGEVLLFLHGWPDNACLWQSQQQYLKAHYKVITPDWLGFGRSDKSADHHYSFASMKSELDAIVMQLLKPEEKLTIIAHDIGGPVAVLWSSDHPKRVRRLILLNTLFYPFQTPLDKLGHFIFNLPIVNRIQMSNFGLKSLMRNLLQNKTPQSLAAIHRIQGSNQSWSYQLRLKTILDPLDKDGRKLLSALAQTFRVLPAEKHLIIAQEDPLCSAHMRRIHEACPEVPAHFLDKCRHFISIDQPDVLNELIEKIISESVKEPSAQSGTEG
jgi:pimeloyl-ACP methyl ester carboxylesterase